MFLHSIRARLTILAALTLGAPIAAAAQTPPAPVDATANFVVLFRSSLIGTEEVTVERATDGWNISATGRVGPPLDVAIRLFEAHYDTAWAPVRLTLDATLRGANRVLETSVNGSSARTVGGVRGSPLTERVDTIDPGSVLLPNPFVAPYEVLAARLQNAAPGTSLPAYEPAVGSFTVAVEGVTEEQIKTTTQLIRAKRWRLSFRFPSGAPMALELWSDENARLLRVSIPIQGLEYAREDIASVATRVVTWSRPNDEDIRIPANGFSLAGTVSKPIDARGPLPAVVLVAGPAPVDRDETLFDVPIFAQLAHALAEAGFLVLRYDKRGVGQSGGRPEAATLGDFADDARAAIQSIAGRKDVDRRRLAVVGHAEGGWMAMLAAGGNGRVAMVGLLSTAGLAGDQVNLWQVSRGLERSRRSETEKQTIIDTQRRIQQAVMTGKGWESIPAGERIRQQADTPYFQSFLTFDPGKVVRNLRQPLLVVQGERDAQVPPTSASALETLAKARRTDAGVETVLVPGVNHLLVPAETGETDEYARLTDRTISSAVTEALVNWLRRTGQQSR